jgi:hypothetical protein
MKALERIWNDVRRGENIDLYLTVVAAFGLGLLNLLGVAPQTLVTPITMAVLGLLAITSLGNRHHIEEQLRQFATLSPSLLRGRSELPSFHKRGQSATEIVIVGVSAITATTPHLDFFEQKMKDGCKLRFLLLDHESQASHLFNLISKVPDVQADIEQTLKSLELLIRMEQTCEGKCEVRLSQVFLAFGLAAFDPDKDTGLMNVEMYAYRRTLGERPHFILTRARDSKWFDFYRGQYEQLWADSKPWKPTAG